MKIAEEDAAWHEEILKSLALIERGVYDLEKLEVSFNAIGLGVIADRVELDVRKIRSGLFDIKLLLSNNGYGFGKCARFLDRLI